jgi:hypothetical protein
MIKTSAKMNEINPGVSRFGVACASEGVSAASAAQTVDGNERRHGIADVVDLLDGFRLSIIGRFRRASASPQRSRPGESPRRWNGIGHETPVESSLNEDAAVRPGLK